MLKYSAGLLILRITFGLLLILHGFNKLLNGIGFIGETMAKHGLPEFLAYAVFLGEIAGPFLIIIGFRTRIGALLIVLNMVAALLLVHYSQLFSLGNSGGWAVELPALYLFGALTLVFTGGGKFAVSSSNWWD